MIIGIVGFAGSGKDTVGNLIKDLYNFQKLSFASKLKDIVSIIFNWPRYLLEGDTEESRIFRETKDEYWSTVFERNITPRDILQYFGTDICRNKLHQDIWVYSLMNSIQSDKNIVISDVRFLNEINAIKNKNGIIIRVKRNEYYEWFDQLKIATGFARTELCNSINMHKSELDWIRDDVWNYEINNDSNLIELQNNVKLLMTDLKKKYIY